MYRRFELLGVIHEPDQAKYGKIVYTYDNDRLKIVSKYAGPGGTPVVLYQGALL